MTFMSKDTVKSIIESGIADGKSVKFIVGQIDKKLSKEGKISDIRFYANKAVRDGTLEQDTAASLYGCRSKAGSPGADKPVKAKKSKASKAGAEDKPVKTKKSKAGAEDKPVKTKKSKAGAEDKPVKTKKSKASASESEDSPKKKKAIKTESAKTAKEKPTKKVARRSKS